MNDPVSRGLLPDSLLYESLLGPKQLHGQLVVGGLEDVLQLVAHPPGLGLGGHGDAPGGTLRRRRRGHLRLGGAVQRDVVFFRTESGTFIEK